MSATIQLIPLLLAISSMIYSLSLWDPEALNNIANRTFSYERDLKICGSLQSGIANLKDEINIHREKSPEDTKRKLHQAYDFILDEIQKYTNENLLPDKSKCQLAIRNHNFEISLRRFNEIDQPKRRVNWTFQILGKPSAFN